jgi:oxalate decarboxylase
MSSIAPTQKTAGGEVRVVDSTNFPVATGVAAAMVTIKPGELREMHWHPNVSEWQYWVKGKGRMTVVTTEAKARTMDFNANDVGFVPTMAGYSIENTGTEDIVFLEVFKARATWTSHSTSGLPACRTKWLRRTSSLPSR